MERVEWRDLSEFGYGKWWGAALGPDGIIYGIPHTANEVLMLDPGSESVATIGAVGFDFLRADRSQWCSAARGADGIIYGVPHNANQVLRIDPMTRDVAQRVTLIGGPYEGREKWISSAVGHDGSIYAFPSSASTILRIDVASQSVGTVGPELFLEPSEDFAPSLSDLCATVAGADGRIYGLPGRRTQKTLSINFSPELTACEELIQSHPGALMAGMNSALTRATILRGWENMLSTGDRDAQKLVGTCISKLYGACVSV